MSYDIRFAIKGEPNDRMYVVFEPEEYASPTYNIGTLLRRAMNWDFEQGKWYKVSDIIDNIKNGISALLWHSEEYKQYEPENGWGTVGSALKCLKSIVKTIEQHTDEYNWEWNKYDIEYLYISW